MSRVNQIVIINHGKYKDRIAVVLKDMGDNLEVKLVPKPVENFVKKNKVFLFLTENNTNNISKTIEKLQDKIRQSAVVNDSEEILNAVNKLESMLKKQKAGKRKSKRKTKKKRKTIKIKKRFVRFLYLFI